MLWLRVEAIFTDMPWLNQLSLGLGLIESIRTPFKFVIRCKIAPNFDGVLGAYTLPLS